MKKQEKKTIATFFDEMIGPMPKLARIGILYYWRGEPGTGKSVALAGPEKQDLDPLVLGPAYEPGDMVWCDAGGDFIYSAIVENAYFSKFGEWRYDLLVNGSPFAVNCSERKMALDVNTENRRYFRRHGRIRP